MNLFHHFFPQVLLGHEDRITTHLYRSEYGTIVLWATSLEIVEADRPPRGWLVPHIWTSPLGYNWLSFLHTFVPSSMVRQIDQFALENWLSGDKNEDGMNHHLCKVTKVLIDLKGFLRRKSVLSDKTFSLNFWLRLKNLKRYHYIYRKWMMESSKFDRVLVNLKVIYTCIFLKICLSGRVFINLFCFVFV